MKVSDYIFSFLESRGVDTVFYLPGGGCMHLLDAMGAHQNIQAVSLLHEQAVAVACEAYANTSGGMGAALVTTGPGGTNAVTGILAAYLDSTPCFFLSGQVKTADLKSRYGVRSLGSQEADVVSIVSPITKYAVMVTDKHTIRYHLERAWFEATSGRRGPVLLDIPLDVQGAQIDADTLEGFSPPTERRAVDVSAIIGALNRSRRAVLIAGNGLANCKAAFYELLDYLAIPVIPTWKAMDYIPNAHPLYAGRAGGMGDRPGNLTMQNSDLILSLGCRLDFSITGYDRSEWARRAVKIVVDIDPAELAKLEGGGNILPITADAADVINGLLERKNEIQIPDLTPWTAQIAAWKTKYPPITRDKYITAERKLTTYALVDLLCKNLPEDARVAPCSAGTTAEIFFQAFTVKAGQTVRSNHGLGSMGFEIPNAIGVCIASGGKDTVCIAGDGGMQLNIQELAVIRGRNLPIKLFVINNDGYASIRNMQNNHFEGRHVGCDAPSGLFLPELHALSAAYGLPYYRVETPEEAEAMLQTVLAREGPVLCEVVADGECLVTPRSATRVLPDGSMRSSPLENQFPFLPDGETAENML
jgi:acetolactate synthase-1/2/3 large subunit